MTFLVQEMIDSDAEESDEESGGWHPSDASEDDDLMNEELGVMYGLSKSQERRIDWVF